MRLQSRLAKIEGQLQGLQAQDVSWIIPLLPTILGQEPPEKLTEALWLMSSGMEFDPGWKVAIQPRPARGYSPPLLSQAGSALLQDALGGSESQCSRPESDNPGHRSSRGDSGPL